jgi:hypothetical protein
MLMETTIPTGEAAIVFFAERLGALRSLDETEVRVLNRAIIRETGAFRRWTAEEDTKLLKMHKAKIRGAQMAETLHRSVDSVVWRLRMLKKGRKGKSRG